MKVSDTAENRRFLQFYFGVGLIRIRGKESKIRDNFVFRLPFTVNDNFELSNIAVLFLPGVK